MNFLADPGTLLMVVKVFLNGFTHPKIRQGKPAESIAA